MTLGDGARTKKRKARTDAADPAPTTPGGESDVAAQPARGAADPAADGRLLYIGGLPFNYEEADVRAAFGECGEISHVHCMRFPDTGKFRGIALVTFADAEAAARAKAYDGTEWEGRFLVIKPGRALPKGAGKTAERDADSARGVRPDERPKPQGSTTAYCGNLSFDADEAALRHFFADCPIAGVRMPTDKATGRHRGIAFVEFEDDAALERAMGRNGELLLGREVAMHYSTTTGPSAKQRAAAAAAARAAPQAGAAAADGGAGRRRKGGVGAKQRRQAAR